MVNKPLYITDTILRDAHQSLIATRMTTEEMLPMLPLLDKIGFHSLECWGGATFDSCLRYLNEDPWERLRKLHAALPNTPIQMLLRGQNLLGYRHYADDVVDHFVNACAKNGIGVFRIFDACNDPRNLKRATDAAKKTGAHVQMAISYATTPYHTKEVYADLAKSYADFGADSICIKDMAGVLLPNDAYELISRIKKEVKLPIELHTHCTGGVAEMTIQKAIEAGVDIVDTALSPFSGGTSQPCTEALEYVLQGTEYDPQLDLKALKEACDKLTAIKDKYLASGTLNPKALTTNPNILKYQVPGGMLSNLMSQLQGQGAMDKYEEVLKEIPRVRKDLGYPPLVTPLSQMVGTQAVMNVLFGERYKSCPKEIIEYLKGNYGQAPAEVNEDVRKKIIGDAEVITYRPADKIAPEFDAMKEKYGNICKCDEDVLSCALFENVAVKFLEAKYAPKEEDEVVEFNVVIG